MELGYGDPTEHLSQPAAVAAAYAATVRAQVAILATLNIQIKTLEGSSTRWACKPSPSGARA